MFKNINFFEHISTEILDFLRIYDKIIEEK